MAAGTQDSDANFNWQTRVGVPGNLGLCRIVQQNSSVSSATRLEPNDWRAS